MTCYLEILTYFVEICQHLEILSGNFEELSPNFELYDIINESMHSLINTLAYKTPLVKFGINLKAIYLITSMVMSQKVTKTLSLKLKVLLFEYRMRKNENVYQGLSV